MKINLAENMLRFGAKNLTSASKQKLNQLAEQEQPTVSVKPMSAGATQYQDGSVAFSGAFLAFGKDTAILYNKADRTKRVVIGPTTVTIDGQAFPDTITKEDSFNILAFMARTLYGKCGEDEAISVVQAVKNLTYAKGAPVEVKNIAKQIMAVQADIIKFPMDDVWRFTVATFPNSRKIDRQSRGVGNGYTATFNETQLIYQKMNSGNKPSALNYDKQPGQRLNPNKPQQDPGGQIPPPPAQN